MNVFLRSIDLSAFRIDDKKKLHQRIKELQPKASVRAIGEATGTPTTTVQRHVNPPVPNGTPGDPADPSDQHGQQAPVPNGTPEARAFERTAKAVADSQRQRIERIKRDEVAEQRRVAEARQEAEVQPEPARTEIRHGDFRDVLADLSDVDAVITDPPYPAEYLPLLADLAVWADKVLAPDGVLAVLIGQTHLPEVYRLLGGHRPYRWTCCYLTVGPGYVSHQRKVQSSWKPLLVYGGDRRLGDVVRSTSDAKQRHRWGQNYEAFRDITERLTSRGQTVVDPFMGAGTTLLAAHALGRHAIGCDIDADAVATARERLGG